ALPIVAAEVATVGAPDEPGHDEHVREFVVIPDRLLGIDAVGSVLLERLALQLTVRAVAPTLAALPQRPGHARDEQTGQLAQQMIVRRRMAREMPADEAAVLIDARQPPRAKRFARCAVEHG